MFKISRLNTIPNPGTSSLPFGTCGCDVLGVVPLDVLGGGADWGCVLVFPDEAAGGAVVVSAVGAGEAGMGGASAGGSGGGSGAGAGAGGVGSWVAGTLIGLAGLTGLVMFVGLV